MSNIKVSIIMPLGTNRGYFSEALKSSLIQDYNNSEYEIIIVNDNVPEITLEHIVNFLKNYPDRPSVIFYNVNFSSLSKTINYGIEKARGKYYTIVPDDDRILPNKLKDLAEELDKNEYDVVYSLAYRINKDGERTSDEPKLLQYAAKHNIIEWKHIVKGDGLFVNGISTMYTKESSRKIGHWDENLLRAEEWELHLRFLKMGYKIKFVEKYTTEYRIHGYNKSKRRGSVEGAQQLKYIYKKLEIGEKK